MFGKSGPGLVWFYAGKQVRWRKFSETAYVANTYVRQSARVHLSRIAVFLEYVKEHLDDEGTASGLRPVPDRKSVV